MKPFFVFIVLISIFIVSCHTNETQFSQTKEDSSLITISTKTENKYPYLSSFGESYVQFSNDIPKEKGRTILVWRFFHDGGCCCVNCSGTINTIVDSVKYFKDSISDWANEQQRVNEEANKIK